MTKSKSKKAKNAAKAMSQALASPTLQQGGEAIAKVASKRKKNKGFWDIVGGAAQMAAQLAPIIAPLLVAGPSANGRAALGATQAAAAGVSMPVAPVATGSCATCTGMYDVKPYKGADGRVIGVKVKGMDFLGTLDVNGETLGTLLREVDLNPLSEDWAGTMLQLQARMFERYRPIRVVGMVESACPSTTAGQVLSYIDADPDDTYEVGGKVGIQSAATHEGADIAQVWQTSAACLAFDQNTADYYADADGSDERLISPGKWRVIANTAMPASTTIGSLYCIWEYHFRIPQLEQESGGAYARLANESTGTVAVPFGTDDWESLEIDGVTNTFTGSYSAAGPGGAYSTFWNLPEGMYWLFVGNNGDTSADITLNADGTNYVLDVGGVSPASMFSATSAMYLTTLQVNERSTDPDDGYLTVAFPALTTVTDPQILFTQIPRSVSTPKKMTLQDFERELISLRADVATMRGSAHAAAAAGSGLAHVPRLSSAAVPSHKFIKQTR